MNGIGLMAAPFISITGLNKRELPVDTCPSGVLLMKINGLSAEANANIRNTAPGYVCFVRNQKDKVSGKTFEQKKNRMVSRTYSLTVHYKLLYYLI